MCRPVPSSSASGAIDTEERPLISVIIPTLNEGGVLGNTVQKLRQQAPPFEVVVVDGGSTDETRERGRKAGATVLRGPPGRGTQLNLGARAAKGEILLFLHADTHLPPNGLTHIRERIERHSATAGTFQLTFDEPTPLLEFYAWWTRWPWIRLCFGDRGLWVKRSAFDAVGGYPEWPLFEDLELASRLDADGNFHFLDAAVTTSARRFRRNGALLQQLRNLYLWLHYIAGTDPERLASLYPYPARSTPSDASERAS